MPMRLENRRKKNDCDFKVFLLILNAVSRQSCLKVNCNAYRQQKQTEVKKNQEVVLQILETVSAFDQIPVLS